MPRPQKYGEETAKVSLRLPLSVIEQLDAHGEGRAEAVLDALGYDRLTMPTVGRVGAAVEQAPQAQPVAEQVVSPLRPAAGGCRCANPSPTFSTTGKRCYVCRRPIDP